MASRIQQFSMVLTLALVLMAGLAFCRRVWLVAGLALEQTRPASVATPARAADRTRPTLTVLPMPAEFRPLLLLPDQQGFWLVGEQNRRCSAVRYRNGAAVEIVEVRP